jgi:NitT/TauT family transport system substrate-binding protein
MADGETLSGKVPDLSIAQGVNITRRDILNIPSAPTILPDADGKLPLATEFNFLKQLGKIPANNTGTKLTESFSYDGLAQVMKDPRRYNIRKFQYE